MGQYSAVASIQERGRYFLALLVQPEFASALFAERRAARPKNSAQRPSKVVERLARRFAPRGADWAPEWRQPRQARGLQEWTACLQPGCRRPADQTVRQHGSFEL